MPNQNKQPTKSTSLIPEDGNHLASHRAYLSNPVRVNPNQIDVGDVIKFMYNGEERTVFVLNPEWHMFLHGLSMKAIDRRTLMVEIVAKADIYKTPADFYTRVIKQEAIQKTDSYRTYEIRKMGHIRKFTYQIDERGREKAGTGELHSTTDQSFEVEEL